MNSQLRLVYSKRKRWKKNAKKEDTFFFEKNGILREVGDCQIKLVPGTVPWLVVDALSNGFVVIGNDTVRLVSAGCNHIFSLKREFLQCRIYIFFHIGFHLCLTDYVCI